jgi:hypothetical protein
MAAPATSSRLTTERISFRAWLGVVLLFVLFGLIVAVLIGASPRGDTYEEKRAKAREDKLKTARDEAAKDLNSYAWVDKGKGVARIPIDRAMQLTVAELAQRKPEPANPIESPPAPAAASPAPQPATPATATASPPATPESAATQTGANQPSPTPSAPPAQGSVTPAAPSIQGPKNPEIRGQPAAAANPPNAQPGSQPGASTTPAAAPSPPSGQPAVSPSVTPSQNSPGTPVPIAGKTPTP